ncbi:MAG: PIN domain-containing protein [Caldilineaceae bacterium]
MNFPKTVFVDTSFFIALANSADADHQQAIAFQSEISAQKIHKITSTYVLFELGDGLSRLRFRSLAYRLIEVIHQDKTFQVVPPSTALFEQALDLFHRRQDKEWGLTDCSSFIIMQQMKLSAALTTDQHFEQAGFHALLRINKA